MANKTKKLRLPQGSRNREKNRRICIKFDKQCLALALTAAVSAVLIWNRSYDLASTGAEGFPALFLLVLAFVPIEVFEAVCHFLEMPEAAAKCSLPWVPGFAALFSVVAVWAAVRFIMFKRKGINAVKIAMSLVKIFLVWGIFQLFCFFAVSAFDDKEEDSVRVLLKHDAPGGSFGKAVKVNKK